MKKLSETDKYNIRYKAYETLFNMKKIFEERETIELLDKFKNIYNICEMVYKTILSEHQAHLNNESDITKLKLDMRQVPHALNFAGYNFDTDILVKLFGSKQKGFKTLKEIRNGLTHGFNKNMIQILKEKEKEIFDLMNEFLNVFLEEFVDVA